MTIHIIGKGGMAKDWIDEMRNQPIYARHLQMDLYDDKNIEKLRPEYFDLVFFCLGYPKDRRAMFNKVKVLINNDGNMIFHSAFIGADTKIGKQVLLHTHSSVGHDSVIGDFVSLMPGARVSGKCEIGEGVMIGANAVILPGVKVGAWAQIGAGCVIARDVNPGEVWVAGLSKCVRVEDER